MKETIRILALHLAFGGVEKAVVNMANLFVEQGHPVEILCVYKMPDSPAFPLDSRVRVSYLLKDIPNRREFRESLRAKNPLRILKEGLKAVRILRQKKLCVRRAIRGITDGVVITTRHEDNLALSRHGQPGVFKIAQLHHDHRFEPRYVKGFAEGYQTIDVFTLLTPQLVEEVRVIMKDNRHTRLVCVPNFLSEIPPMPDISGREKTIMAVGRLNSVKGFDRLLEDFARIHARVPQWRLQIVGEGEERPVLEELIRRLSLQDCAELTGQKNAAEIQEMMQKASLYAMSSHSEGFPFVLLEAFSCALPVAAYDVRVGPRAVIEDRINGFLVPDNDRQSYQNAVLKLMEDTELRGKMAGQAYRRAQEFSAAAVGRLWQTILEDERIPHDEKSI